MVKVSPTLLFHNFPSVVFGRPNSADKGDVKEAVQAINIVNLLN